MNDNLNLEIDQLQEQLNTEQDSAFNNEECGRYCFPLALKLIEKLKEKVENLESQLDSWEHGGP